MYVSHLCKQVRALRNFILFLVLLTIPLVAFCYTLTLSQRHARRKVNSFTVYQSAPLGNLGPSPERNNNRMS